MLYFQTAESWEKWSLRLKQRLPRWKPLWLKLSRRPRRLKKWKPVWLTTTGDTENIFRVNLSRDLGHGWSWLIMADHGWSWLPLSLLWIILKPHNFPFLPDIPPPTDWFSLISFIPYFSRISVVSFSVTCQSLFKFFYIVTTTPVPGMWGGGGG